MGEGLRRLKGQACRLSRRQDRWRVARPRLVDQVGERTPFDELHGVEVDPLLAADLEDRDNVRVIQRRVVFWENRQTRTAPVAGFVGHDTTVSVRAQITGSGP